MDSGAPGGDLSRIARRRMEAERDPSRDYASRREALIEAAGNAFQTKGFQATRMADVADEFGVNRATLYYYFGSKEQLFRAVIFGALEDNLREAQAIAVGGGTPTERLRELLVGLMSSYERHYPLLFVWVQEDMNKLPSDNAPEAERLRELGDAYEETIKQIIHQGVAAGEFNPSTNVTVVAYAIIGAANWSHRWFRPGRNLSGAEVGEVFADLFLAGLSRDPDGVNKLVDSNLTPRYIPARSHQGG